jgi:hypothetical protein
MQTARDIAPYVALAAVALALILLVSVIALWVSVRRMRHAQMVVLGHNEERDVVAHMASLDSQVRNMRDALTTLTGELEGHGARLDDTITHRSIVRYDAFRDSGGEQSASLALLDNHRSGIVLSTIAARDFARVYVKYLRNGAPDRDLSPEELQAVEEAVPQPLPAHESPHAAGPQRLSRADAPPWTPATLESTLKLPLEPPADAGIAAPKADAGVEKLSAVPLADSFEWDSGDDRRGT